MKNISILFGGFGLQLLLTGCLQQFEITQSGHRLESHENNPSSDESSIPPPDLSSVGDLPPSEVASIDVEVPPAAPTQVDGEPDSDLPPMASAPPVESRSPAEAAPAPPLPIPPRVVDGEGTSYCHVPPPGPPTGSAAAARRRKILICHKPNGSLEKGQNKLIPEVAWRGHKVHGDHLGPCGQTPAAQPSTVVYRADDCE